MNRPSYSEVVARVNDEALANWFTRQPALDSDSLAQKRRGALVEALCENAGDDASSLMMAQRYASRHGCSCAKYGKAVALSAIGRKRARHLRD